MKQELFKEINKKKLYILKRKEASELLETCYIDIEDTIPLFPDNLDHFENGKKLIDYLRNSKDLEPLWLYCSGTCTNIGSSFDGFHSLLKKPDLNYELEHLPDIAYYVKRLNDTDNSSNEYYKDISVLKKFLTRRKNSYLLQRSIEKCKSNKDLLIHSHRNLGNYILHGIDRKIKITLNKDFGGCINTNFGFGQSSYFEVVLFYKGILIMPYSSLVNNRKTNHSSRKFPVEDLSWGYAIDFICYTYNNYIKYGDSFIIDYIEQECNQMVKGLDSILTKNEFEFYPNKKEELEILLKLESKPNNIAKTKLFGHELIKFRGEKASESLGFIDSLKKLNEVTSKNSYIECLEIFCIEVLSQLEKELIILCEELKKLNSELELRKTIYEANQAEKKIYSNIGIKWEIYKNESKIESEESFKSNYPEYSLFIERQKTIEEEYINIDRKYWEINNKFNEHKNLKYEIERYKDLIEKYFIDKREKS